MRNTLFRKLFVSLVLTILLLSGYLMTLSETTYQVTGLGILFLLIPLMIYTLNRVDSNESNGRRR